MRKKVPILFSQYNRSNLNSVTTQHLTNMYIEQYEDGSDRPKVAALSTPGCTLVRDLGGTQIQGMIPHKQYIYVVAGGILYKLQAESTSFTTIGSISDNNGLVRMDAIDDEIIVVSVNSGTVWSYKVTANTFAQVTASQFVSPVTGNITPVNSVVGFNGYFLYLLRDSKVIMYSNLNDGRTIQALNFFQANAYYENINCLVASNNYIYLISTMATEVWSFSGNTSVVFSRVSGGTLQYGCLSPFAYGVSADNVYFLASDKTGIKGLGIMNGPQVVLHPSTFICDKVNSYFHSNQAYSFIDTINGHSFFNITIPYAEDTRGRTYAADTANGSWIERSSYNPNGISFPTEDQYIASCAAFVSTISGTKYFIGDYFSGKLYLQSKTTFTDNGNVIFREIQTPHLIQNDQYFTLSNLEVDIERSQGLDGTAQGSSPTIIIQYSKDRGHTWSQEITRICSVLGNNRARVRIGSLGSSRVFTFRFRMTDPINWTVVDMTVEMDKQEENGIYGLQMI